MQSFILSAALMGAAVNGLVFPRQTVCGSIATQNYTIAQGDTLTSVAERFSSGVCDIASVNGLTNPNLIQLGQTLTIPLNCTKPDNDSCVKKEPTPTELCVPGPPSTYDVRQNDTLSAISINFNITLDALIGANPQISNPDVIDVKQIINIPVCPNSACIFSTYIVKQGDLFYDLADHYGASTGQILAANVGIDPTQLAVGQQITLPWACRNVTSWAELGAGLLQ